MILMEMLHRLLFKKHSFKARLRFSVRAKMERVIWKGRAPIQGLEGWQDLSGVIMFKGMNLSSERISAHSKGIVSWGQPWLQRQLCNQKYQ